MTNNLEINKRIHDKLPVCDTGNRFFAKPSNARDLLLALHVDNPGQVSAIGVPIDSYKLGNVNRLPVVNALFIDMPYPY